MLTTSGRVECFVPVKRLFVLMLLAALEAFAQGNSVELRIKVTDLVGLGIACNVDVASEPNHYHHSFTTGDDGKLTITDLQQGDYLLQLRFGGGYGRPQITGRSLHCATHSDVGYTALSLTILLGEICYGSQTPPTGPPGCADQDLSCTTRDEA